MTNFTKNSVLDFGKYNGKTLCEVFAENPGYIEWCMKKVEFFELDDNTINELQLLRPGFKFSSEARKSNEEKVIYKPEPVDPWEGFGRRYDQYEGGPTGYLSDDFIDYVLDGEPDAYWNID